jgi:hypothetical protein
MTGAELDELVKRLRIGVVGTLRGHGYSRDAQAAGEAAGAIERLAKELDVAEASARTLREALQAIEGLLSEELAARFGHHSKSEEEVAGKSVIYSLLAVPRNMARAALAPLLEEVP